MASVAALLASCYLQIKFVHGVCGDVVYEYLCCLQPVPGDITPFDSTFVALLLVLVLVLVGKNHWHLTRFPRMRVVSCTS